MKVFIFRLDTYYEVSGIGTTYKEAEQALLRAYRRYKKQCIGADMPVAKSARQLYEYYGGCWLEAETGKGYIGDDTDYPV